MSDGGEPVQLAFEDGELVERTPPTERAADERVEPGEESGFVVDVKPGSLDVNGPLREAVDTHGRRLEFGSRAHAETYAHRLSTGDGDLRLQAAAPNDPGDADGYLLAAHDPSISEPAEIDGDTLTFDVGANLYGALGEAILLESPRPHALYWFVQQDLDFDDGDFETGLHLDVQPGNPISHDESGKHWVPDCVVVARDGWDGPLLERYYCEIKTGNASFERSQVAVMQRLARDECVLKIRMLIEELPERYSMRVDEVEPTD